MRGEILPAPDLSPTDSHITFDPYADQVMTGAPEGPATYTGNEWHPFAPGNLHMDGERDKIVKEENGHTGVEGIGGGIYSRLIEPHFED